MKHGSDQTASFTISRTPKTLNIQVTNQAIRTVNTLMTTSVPVRLGLVGMRERVTGLGGSLSHGPAPTGPSNSPRPYPCSRTRHDTVVIADDQDLVRSGLQSSSKAAARGLGEAPTADRRCRWFAAQHRT